ncbi:2-polyprenyl-6-methoxyphenol hydroxylase-like oxidoreductase [Saccharomonospora marina XMU15]|uniref:2-polyprenyl-6-methoxyphenol hydroxylase-like oxidoreductase n=1 Tax=Saccharomonospora marina XMU15 TaxID=882083 RepID=H5X421_9PSEU|nr:NAD(P)/FAD-dependent oxidoreductase [Saccharomonospora marina]EHR53292.1 2-polyprenyl-6-methoxyphenol hydroxylase-like oxidoreductase [Saccharomonospora marina XMU15]
MGSSNGALGPVAVVGAGLSGLCLAQYLSRAGVDVHVYEKDPGPFVRRQGYRITADEHGLAALRASLPPRLYELVLATGGEPGGHFRFTDERLRDAFKLTFRSTPDGGRQLDRQVLRSSLLVGLDDRVHYGKAAASLRQEDGDELLLEFADDTSVRASLVVGADGIGSALRARIAPGGEPVSAGLAGIYGRTPLEQHGKQVVPDVLRTSGVLALGKAPGRSFFFTSMRFPEPPQAVFDRLAPDHKPPPCDDYVMWGLTLHTAEVPEEIRADPLGLRTLAARLAHGFHPLIARLIDTADDDATVLSRFVVGQRPTTWSLPRATLLGDAVHAMPPFGAHGGNTALQDAALLGRKLLDSQANGTSVAAAVAAYQTEMQRYAFKAVDSAAAMMRRLTTDGIQKWLMMRVLPKLHRVTVPETV